MFPFHQFGQVLSALSAGMDSNPFLSFLFIVLSMVFVWLVAAKTMLAIDMAILRLKNYIRYIR